jgi:hypothetical protein
MRTLLNNFFACVALTLIFPMSASARDIVWDGKTYLSIGLQARSDTVVKFPEPVFRSAEQESAFEAAEFGDGGQTFIFTPKQQTEQRIFFRGATTGTIFIARVSTSIPYEPFLNVVNRISNVDTLTTNASNATPATASSPGAQLTNFVKSMMQGIRPSSFEQIKADQMLLDAGTFRITATHAWRSANTTGVFVRIIKTTPAPEIRIIPEEISLKSQVLGDLRMFGADRWILNDQQTTTNGYLIFTR